MNSVCQSLLADIVRIGKSPTEDPAAVIRSLHVRIMDYADSLIPKSQGRKLLEDYEEAMNQLTELADDLDEVCDTLETAEDDDSREEALENALELLTELGASLQELEPLSQYIATTPDEVEARWGRELARLGTLPKAQRQKILDTILDQTRTAKETALVLDLVEEALRNKGS